MAVIRTSTGTAQEVATENGPMTTAAGSRQYGLVDDPVVGATQIPGADTYFYQNGSGMQEVTPAAGGGVLRGDAWGTFAGMPDGVPTVAQTGEPILRDMVGDATTRQALVSNGYLIAPDTAVGSTGVYTGIRLQEDMKAFYVRGSFELLTDVSAVISAANVSLAAILASSVHPTFSPKNWNLSYFSAGSSIPVASGSYDQVPFGTDLTWGWRFVGTDVYMLLPNGQEVGPISSPEVVSRANHAAIFEHNRGSTGPIGLKYRGWAVNRFANPIAAGRTNLFTQQNNLANAAWTKVGLQSPVSGQPDADGGLLAERVLETATTGFHSIQQTLTKDATARRYSVRYKVKGIARDAAFIGLGGGFAGLSQYFGLSSGALPASGGSFTDKAFMVYPLGNDWYQIQADFKTSTETSVAVLMAASTGTSSGNANYTGDITKGLEDFDQWLFERPV